MIPITANDTFRFDCTPDVSCFNECCRNLNQLLFPYDILRLRKHFKITSRAFLEQYTSCNTGPESGLPVVTLRPNNDAARTCPFVSKGGCRVYVNRPASCRIYPLARAISRHRQTGQMREQFVLLKEPHCRGHESSKTWTVQQWVTAQQLDEYNRVNDQLIELISLKNQNYHGPLDLATTRMVYTACYDLDTFRNWIFKNEWGNKQNQDADTRSRLATDDPFLLDFALNWVKEKLLT